MKKQFLYSLMAAAIAFGSVSSLKPVDTTAASSVSTGRVLSDSFQKEHPSTIIIAKTEEDIAYANEKLVSDGYTLVKPIGPDNVTRIPKITLPPSTRHTIPPVTKFTVYTHPIDQISIGVNVNIRDNAAVQVQNMR